MKVAMKTLLCVLFLVQITTSFVLNINYQQAISMQDDIETIGKVFQGKSSTI